MANIYFLQKYTIHFVVDMHGHTNILIPTNGDGWGRYKPLSLFDDIHSSFMSHLSLDKMLALFEDIHCSIMNLVSLDKMIINFEAYEKYYLLTFCYWLK